MKKEITLDIVCAVVELLNQGASVKRTASEIGISEATVGRIKRKEGRYKFLVEDCNEKEEKEPEIKEEKVPEEDSKEPRRMTADEIQKKIENLTGDILINDLSVILSKYMSPLLIKFSVDNFVLDDKFKDLITIQMVDKIKESKNVNFYSQSLSILVMGILSRLFPEDVVQKLMS